MNDDYPYLSPFPPKPGLTEAERRKVKAWEKTGKITICPAVGSPELARIEIKKYLKWLAEVGMPMKIKLGLIPLKHPERTEKERKERCKQQQRDWHRRKKEENKK